jgi:PST family polysaccharide transporter
MAAPIVAFAQLFADCGLTQATIQRSEITQAQLSFLFWLNVCVSAVVAIVVIVLSPLTGILYRERHVIGVTASLGVVLIFSGLANQHMALLNRSLSFNKLAIIDVVSFSLGAICGLLAAHASLGYWSIILAQGSTVLVGIVLAWFFCKWRPSGPTMAEDWRSLVRVGGNITSFNIVNYFARNLDNVLIGCFNGEAALGLYDRAYKLLLMPLNQISQPLSRVALPLLSRSLEDARTYRTAYHRIVGGMLLLTYPGVLFAIATHDQLIRRALGEKWMGVSPIFAILGIGALFAPVSNSTGWLFISQNRTGEMRNWGVISSTMFVMSFIVGLRWGPIGVATCYIAAGMIQGPLIWWAATRTGPVGFSDLAKTVWPYVLSGAGCYLVLCVVRNSFYSSGLLLSTLVAITYIVFGGILVSLPSGRADILDLWRYRQICFGK